MKEVIVQTIGVLVVIATVALAVVGVFQEFIA
jgi:hypothetical protein